MTVGVYGLVAAIVKMDDLGLLLSQRQSGFANGAQQAFGRALLLAAPKLMKTLTVLGTAAMFLVGGGILAHGWHAVGAGIEQLSVGAGDLMQPVAAMALNLLFGLVAGAVALGAVLFVQRLRSRWF